MADNQVGSSLFNINHDRLTKIIFDLFKLYRSEQLIVNDTLKLSAPYPLHSACFIAGRMYLVQMSLSVSRFTSMRTAIPALAMKI